MRTKLLWNLVLFIIITVHWILSARYDVILDQLEYVYLYHFPILKFYFHMKHIKFRCRKTKTYRNNHNTRNNTKIVLRSGFQSLERKLYGPIKKRNKANFIQSLITFVNRKAFPYSEVIFFHVLEGIVQAQFYGKSY